MSPRARKVPRFSLYGDSTAGGPPHVHIEEIATRSRRYRWHISPHAHPALHQCLYVDEGPVEIDLDGQRSRLAAPALILLPPETVHAFRFDADTRGYVVSVDGASLLGDGNPLVRARFMRTFAAPSALALQAGSDADGRLRALCEQLLVEFRLARGEAPPTCIWLARSLLWVAGEELTRLRPGEPAPRPPARHYERLRLLVEENYARHWPVTRYAHALGLGVARLNSLCRAESGHSLRTLLAQRLALEARRRLAHLALPVGGIALELGFRDAAYFSRFFRRHAGCTPLAFRRRHAGSPPGGPPGR